MISVYKLKPAFQRLLSPLLKLLRKLGFTPNALTLLTVALSAVVGGLFYHYHLGIMLIVLPLFLLFRMALNALDGMMATTYNMKSKLGEILNELGDILSDIFLYLPLVVLPHSNTLLIVGFVLMAVINEFSGILAKAVSGVRRYDGPMGKSDRALLVGFTLLISYFHIDALHYLNLIIIGAMLLMVWSTYLRLARCLKLGV